MDTNAILLLVSTIVTLALFGGWMWKRRQRKSLSK